MFPLKEADLQEWLDGAWKLYASGKSAHRDVLTRANKTLILEVKVGDKIARVRHGDAGATVVKKDDLLHVGGDIQYALQLFNQNVKDW